MRDTHTLVVGAGAAGLATAACLQRAGIEAVIIEQTNDVASAWRNHYDRLQLHTSKKWSALPFMQFDRTLPRYPSRQHVVDYLENYASELGLHPVFNETVLSVRKQAGDWITQTSNGSYRSRFVVIATGRNHQPFIPHFDGLETFNGTILHSAHYKNGAPFAGQQVLVVGFGNSGCEQALCLYEHGAVPSMSVRSPVNVLPKEIAGFPILEIGKVTSILPPWVADKLTAPLIRLIVGDITKLGLIKSAYGPREQIQKLGKIPMLDTGIMRLIKQGQIKIFGDIREIKGNQVHFENNIVHRFDAILFATGYRHNINAFLQLDDERTSDLLKPVRSQLHFGRDGLYGCGFYVSPMGMLHEIGIEARKIAKDIAGRKK